MDAIDALTAAELKTVRLRTANTASDREDGIAASDDETREAAAQYLADGGQLIDLTR